MSSPLFADRYGLLVQLLVEARRSAGLTQNQLAERMGKLQSYVSKVERRERRLDPIELYDWAKALGSPPLEIFSRLVDALERF